MVCYKCHMAISIMAKNNLQLEQRWRAVCIEKCSTVRERTAQTYLRNKEKAVGFPLTMWATNDDSLWFNQYANINSSYWQEHFYAFGRL